MLEFDPPLRSLLQILHFAFISFLLFSKIISILSKKFHIFELSFLLNDARGVATPKPDPTRKTSPNRNQGMPGLFLIVIVLLNFYFQKCRDPNPWPDLNGGSEPEPGLLRRFHLSYQNIFINSFSCGNGLSFGPSP